MKKSGKNRVTTNQKKKLWVYCNSPLQDELWMSFTAILERREDNEDDGRGLVNISASWWAEQIGRSLMDPSVTLSRTKCPSICLVRSWNVGLEAMWRAAWLSQNKIAGDEAGIWKSRNSCVIHIISLIVTARARYSASAEELDTMGCFLARHDKRESPRKMQKPVIDFRESGQAA